MTVCGYELLNERKTASLGRCRFTIGKTGVQPTLKGQMNQKIDIFSFVALPLPTTKKNHPK